MGVAGELNEKACPIAGAGSAGFWPKAKPLLVDGAADCPNEKDAEDFSGAFASGLVPNRVEDDDWPESNEKPDEG